MTSPVDPLAIAGLVVDVLDLIGARYSIGGSLASSFAGEPRSTLDVDIVVELTPAQVEPLAQALARDFYLDRSALLRAVSSRSSANLIHLDTSIKIDLFVAGGTALDASLLARRQRVLLGESDRAWCVHTPEDIALQKLRWFRLGGETSERQWRDVLGIVRVQGLKWDLEYLRTGARTLGVEDLLDRAMAAPGP